MKRGWVRAVSMIMQLRGILKSRQMHSYLPDLSLAPSSLFFPHTDDQGLGQSSMFSLDVVEFVDR